MRKRSTLPMGTLLLLYACSSGPNFRPPSPPEVPTFTSKDEALPQQQHIELGKRIETEWWSLFASEPLNDLIHQAVQNNYDLASARESLAQAREAVKAESASRLPQAALGATTGRQKYGAALFGPANFSIPPFNYYEFGPSASWAPDISGGEHRSLERQQALAEYQAHELDAAYITLTGNIVEAVLDMTSAKAEIAAAERIIAEDERTLELVQQSYAAGSATKLDILTAQSQLTDDHATLPPLEQRLSAARHALSILVGKAPANWTPPNFDFYSFKLPRELPLSLPSELAKNRPDILAAQSELHATSAAMGMATANLYPHLTLTANMMQEALTPAGLFRSAANAWSLAAGLTAPIFTGGELAAEKREAEHAYQAALARYRQTILSAFMQVADALTALAHDEEAVAIGNDAVHHAGTALNLSRASYRAGAIGLLQVLDAQRAWARTRLDIIHAQHQRYLDCVRLFVALGGSPMAAPRT